MLGQWLRDHRAEYNTATETVKACLENFRLHRKLVWAIYPRTDLAVSKESGGTNCGALGTLCEFGVDCPLWCPYRSGQDIRDMTKCGLIGHYDYYGRFDLHIVRGILQYEQMRERRSVKEATDNNQESPNCKTCGQPLPTQLESKKGRPREYCLNCQSSRSTERYRKWQKRKRAVPSAPP